MRRTVLYEASRPIEWWVTWWSMCVRRSGNRWHLRYLARAQFPVKCHQSPDHKHGTCGYFCIPPSPPLPEIKYFRNQKGFNIECLIHAAGCYPCRPTVRDISSLIC